VRRQISGVISQNVGPQVTNFSPDGIVAARFTRAVSLYWIFIAPWSLGIPPQFTADAKSRTAYAKIIKLQEAKAVRADACYEQMSG